MSPHQHAPLVVQEKAPPQDAQVCQEACQEVCQEACQEACHQLKPQVASPVCQAAVCPAAVCSRENKSSVLISEGI